jgi:hypothetical protein
MKKIRRICVLMISFILLMSMSITAFAGQDSQEAFLVSKEDISSDAQRVLIKTSYFALDKEGDLREIPDISSYSLDLGDYAVVTHTFYDMGYDASKDSHFYEVQMKATLIVADKTISKSVFSIKPKNNKKYMDSTLYHSMKTSIGDTIYYGYAGQGPDSPYVYAKENIYLYGDSEPLTTLLPDYMSRPLKGY